jgi:sugar phosphate permease
MKENSGVFYGWWIALAVFFIWFGWAAQPFAVVLKQLMAQFHCGRGEVSLIPAISSITGGFCAFAVSRLLHRHSPRRFMFAGFTMTGIVLLLCALATRLWHLYIMYFLMGIGFGASGAVVVTALLSKWFVRKRGRALGLALSGFSIGAIFVVPLVGVVAEHFGWRATYLLAGLLMLALGVPLMLLVIKDSPHEMGLLPDGDEPGCEPDNIDPVAAVSPVDPARHVGITAYFTRLPLWLLALSFPVVVMGTSAITQHQFSYVTDIGIPDAIAASAFGFTMGLGGIGGFVSGWMTDRMSPRYVCIMSLLMSIIGVVLLMHVQDMWSLWVFVMVFGLASGVPGVLLPLAIADIFGSASLAVIFGFANILFTCGYALGPPLAGFVFDATGSYVRVFYIAILLYIVSIFAIYFAYGRRLNPRRVNNRA